MSDVKSFTIKLDSCLRPESDYCYVIV